MYPRPEDCPMPTSFTNFEGSVYYWRATRFEDGMEPPMWQAEIGYRPRGKADIEWSKHGMPKQHRGDAEHLAIDRAQYLSRKM